MHTFIQARQSQTSPGLIWLSSYTKTNNTQSQAEKYKITYISLEIIITYTQEKQTHAAIISLDQEKRLTESLMTSFSKP